MNTLEALVGRTTTPQAKMTEPGPDASQLRAILEAGAAAPDHGRLRPWRFLTVMGEGRAALGDLFAEAALQATPEATAVEIDKQRQMPRRVPLIIIVLTRIARKGTKIPAVEQIGSAAAAAQNMLLAAHAMGFAGKWSTGRNADDPIVRRALGVAEHDYIVGFLYIGTTPDRPAPQGRPSLDDVAKAWP